MLVDEWFIQFQEKGSNYNKSKKNKWKIWKTSSSESQGSSTSIKMKKGGAAVSDSSLTSAVAVLVQAPPKDIIIIKQEWAAIRIQALFRAFLVTN